MSEPTKWYCYVCGKRLSKKFILFSLNEATDRVFLVHEGTCKEQLCEEGLITMSVVEGA